MRNAFVAAMSVTLVAATFGFFVVQETPLPKTGPVTEKRFPPLKVPAGFRATLFACDPLIEYPSVISIGPKPGAIFVAIDYMTGLVRDGKVKSEIRLVEDTDGDGYADKATRIAGDFNSIQGLAYYDGNLYVMHAPFLTVLRIRPGKTVLGPDNYERVDLLSGLGLDPKDNRSRLHCANAVVVGHDGWLYLALGDNGVNVPRPEGDQLVYYGGGILRCRPDGRDLHVFSTGLRNIYDIALDAELNVFTRDNENDGGTYMIRVCHCFHGSDHGYPYDYEERPDYAMKPIGDFGLGSSAGGVCYLETQFPKEYRGNLFFCEWGKSLVRYELKPSGSGFAPVKEIEFATGDSKDPYPFKPTDVVVQRDGTMMVSDYADGQEPKRGRGRIYHIAYTGKDAPPVKKSDLESYFDRCEVQAALEKPGSDANFALVPLPAHAQMHVVWAWAKRDGAKALDKLLSVAKSENDVRVRVQAIRAAADLSDPILVKHKLDAGRGDAKVAEYLANLPKRDDPRILREIVIALGRLRWDGTPEWIAKNIKQPDDALAHATMQTLRRADNWKGVLKLLDDSATNRTIALRAVTDQYEDVIVDGLMERVRNDKDATRRREYASALARAYKKPAAWKYWGYRPGPRPANTVAWQRSDAIANALSESLRDPDFDLRMAVLKQMVREKVPVAVETLGEWLAEDNDPSRAAAILASLGANPSRPALVIMHRTILNAKHTDANRLTALDMYFKDYKADASELGKAFRILAGDLGPKHGPVLAEVVRRVGKVPGGALAEFFVRYLGSTSPEVRAAAIEALGNQGLKEGIEPVIAMLGEKEVLVRRAAAEAAGKLGAKKAVDRLLDLASEPDVGVRRASFESLLLLREPRVLKIASTGLNEPALELKSLACIAELGGPAHAKLLVDHAKRHPTTEVVAASVRALAAWRDRAATSDQEKLELYRGIAEIHGAGGIFVHWDVSVPYNPGGRDGIVKVMGVPGKRTRFWHTQFSSGAEGQLTLQPIKPPDQNVRYLFTEIDAPQETPVEFLASSRSTLDVWLNGKSIHRRAMAGKFQIDSDRFTATLQPGMNRILVDAGPAELPFDFHLRFRRKSSKAAHEKLTQAALSRTGNAERGRKIFFDKEKSQCIKCHQIGAQGERIGPELTGVGSRFSRIYLVESILEPSRTIAPSFGTMAVTLKNGKTLNGVKLAEDEKTLTLADNQGQKQVVAKADIEEQNPVAISTMPDGLEARLSEDEFVDLIAFLSSQKK